MQRTDGLLSKERLFTTELKGKDSDNCRRELNTAGAREENEVDERSGRGFESQEGRPEGMGVNRLRRGRGNGECGVVERWQEPLGSREEWSVVCWFALAGRRGFKQWPRAESLELALVPDGVARSGMTAKREKKHGGETSANAANEKAGEEE